MVKAYSYDLRQKVMSAIQLDGMRKSEAAQIFQISRNTIDLWLERQAKTGGYQAKANRPHRTVNRITDWQKFTEFSQTDEDRTQEEIAALWEGEISARSIARALQSIGWTRKKKTYDYRERDEAKRVLCLAPRVAIAPSQRVYMDESGMDKRDDYGYAWSRCGQRLAALKAGRRSGRINMIAAYCKQRLMAPFAVEGACDRVVFET